jgi:hypothetical protein
MRAVLVGAIILAGAGGVTTAEADDARAGQLGGGVAIGINPSLGDVCDSHGDVVGCTTFLPAWAIRAQGTIAIHPRLSASLVLGAGTDLDQSESVSSDGGRGTRGRQLFDVAARLRYEAFGAGRLWVGGEGGIAMARDWSRDYRGDGGLSASAAATQLAPMVGALVGVVLLRHGQLAADLEAGARLTLFGDHPPALNATPGKSEGLRLATEYGTRTWLWLGFGFRYGR